MIVGLLLFTILRNSVVQALPIANFEATSIEAPCEQKISWYRGITEQTKRLYNEYYAKLAEASINPENLQALNEQHMNFKITVSHVFKGPKDDSEKEIDCQAEIDWYKRMNTNLTKVVADIKKELLDLFNRSKVPLSQQKDITDLLNELANFLSIVAFPINQFKELNTLIEESKIDQVDKLLESAHKAEQGHYEINTDFGHTEMYTDRPEDINYYTTSHPPRDDATDPVVQDMYIPVVAIAAGSIVLIIIVIAMVAVLCPCRRSPYRQF